MFAFLALVVELLSAALSKFGHVDLMVNNAGIMNENLVPLTIDINLVSTVDAAAKPVCLTVLVSITRMS